MHRSERMMLLQSIVLVSLCAGLSHGVLYDFYTNKPATDIQLQYYEAEGVTDTCTIDVKPCDKNEPRRLDGTCNNLEHPAGGTLFSPPVRILPAKYYNDKYQRKAKSGDELPLPRTVRTNLLPSGESWHPIFNSNVPGYAIYMAIDIESIHDTENMLSTTNYCCEKEHMNDYECTPNIIPEDDHVFKYTNIRCMNSTRPLTYQDFKCTKDPIPAPIQKATAQFDSSNIYYLKKDGGPIRSYHKGQLIVEEEDGKIFPPNGPNAGCPNNVGTETRCFENQINGFLPTALFSIWFVRYHNHVASQLAELNPCWDDEKLFTVARDINIATSLELYMCEWNSVLQGRDNLIKAGVIAEDGGFRDLYDPKKHPVVTVEYTFILRWFHLLQSLSAKLYDKNGNFIKDFPVVDTAFRTGLLAQNNNMEYFTQSTFRAPCHDNDGTVNEDLSNWAFPNVQVALDAPTGDINKCRHFGLPPYVDYVRHFLNIDITCFEDLAVLIPKDKIKKIQELYGDVEDLDLIVGLWAEKSMEGGHIPLMLANFFNDFFLRSMTSDRHWYEREDRPNAFTKAQLAEIRKVTLAYLMCTVADGVTEIPKHAFLNESPENPMVSCDDIQKLDISAWADETCCNV